MNESPEAIVVITTVADQKDGEALGQALVESGLAACVQALPAMTSVYRWQEHIEYATESVLLIKTTRALYAPLEAAIKQHHRYQTPEIIALPVVAGSADYLTWLNSVVKRQ
jgi:periplasmic divalent cation tolerance protein